MQSDAIAPEDDVFSRFLSVVGIRFDVLAVVAVAPLCLGCFGTRGVDRPDFDPEGSAAKAMATYDTNSDGAIDAEEVKVSPGLLAAFQRTDKDGDQRLTAEEITARVRYYKTAPTVIVQGATRIRYRNRPLPGAQVTFQPEDFLGPAFTPCSGTTDSMGIASIKGHHADFPGIYLGFYRVLVSLPINGKETIPEQYNTASELGYEAAEDIPMVADIITFDLK